MGKEQSFQQTLLRQLDILMQINELDPYLKNGFKIDQTPECKNANYKTFERNISVNHCDLYELRKNF